MRVPEAECIRWVQTNSARIVEMHKKIVKDLGDFISTHLLGCEFIGISSDGEVFVSFESEDPDIQLAGKTKIKEEFGNQIGLVTTIVQTRIEDLQELVDGLNKALEEQEESSPNLLDIGEF